MQTWSSVDPLAENHYDHTPYSYVLGNPVNLIDPLGLDTVSANELQMSTYKEGVDVVQLGEAQVNASVSMSSGERMGWRNERGLDPFTNLDGSTDYGAMYDHQRNLDYRQRMASVWDPQKAIYDAVMFWATGEVGGVVGSYALRGIRSAIGGLAARGGANIGTKLEYVFGKATGSAHNIERSTGMLRQLESVGIFDNAAGRSLLNSHLQGAYNTSKGILQSNGRYLRESLLMGPNGGLKVESIWEGNRLITVKLLGGK